jgi:uncharacterized membrane protein (DUF106 family)
MKGLQIMFLVMILSTFVLFAWDKMPPIKEGVHAILDPTAGVLLAWNTLAGMFIIVLVITFITVLLQKYLTNQEELKKLKAEQKIVQEQMKQFKDHPEKLLELQKKQLEFLPKTMDLTMKPLIYTAVPFVLFFRWLSDYFITSPFKFFGFMSWFWFYLLASLVINSILRKLMKVV